MLAHLEFQFMLASDITTDDRLEDDLEDRGIEVPTEATQFLAELTDGLGLICVLLMTLLLELLLLFLGEVARGLIHDLGHVLKRVF